MNTTKITIDFIQSIFNALSAADKDEYSLVLSGVMFRIERQQVKIAATDGKFLVEHVHKLQEKLKFPRGVKKREFIILMNDPMTHAVLKTLAKPPGRYNQEIEIEMTFNKEELKFNDHPIKLVDGKYPAYDKALEFDPKESKPFADDWTLCLSAGYLGKLKKALGLGQYDSMKMYCQGEGKGIIFKPMNALHSHSTALLMPITCPKETES